MGASSVTNFLLTFRGAAHAFCKSSLLQLNSKAADHALTQSRIARHRDRPLQDSLPGKASKSFRLRNVVGLCSMGFGGMLSDDSEMVGERLEIATKPG